MPEACVVSAGLEKRKLGRGGLCGHSPSTSKGAPRPDGFVLGPRVSGLGLRI